LGSRSIRRQVIPRFTNDLITRNANLMGLRFGSVRGIAAQPSTNCPENRTVRLIRWPDQLQKALSKSLPQRLDKETCYTANTVYYRYRDHVLRGPIMKNTIVALLLASLLWVMATPVSARKWISNDGKFSVDAELVEDKMLIYSDGFVKTYETISEEAKNGLISIKIKAEVLPQPPPKPPLRICTLLHTHYFGRPWRPKRNRFTRNWPEANTGESQA